MAPGSFSISNVCVGDILTDPGDLHFPGFKNFHVQDFSGFRMLDNLSFFVGDKLHTDLDTGPFAQVYGNLVVIAHDDVSFEGEILDDFLGHLNHQFFQTCRRSALDTFSRDNGTV